MDFLVRICDPNRNLTDSNYLKDVHDEKEAVAKAQKIALGAKQGVTVGLFTEQRDVVCVVCGWKVGKDGTLQHLAVNRVRNTCGVAHRDFDLAKTEAAKWRETPETPDEST